MKTRRTLFYFPAACALLVAGWYHWHARQVLAQLTGERARAVAATEEAQRAVAAVQKDAEKVQRQVVKQKSEARGQLSEPNGGTTKPGADGKVAAGGGAAAGSVGNNKVDTAPAKPGPTMTAAEYRALQIDVRVAEQRERYAVLLERLGFSGEQRQRFDALQADARRAELDETLSAAEKQAARARLTEGLKVLFGPAYDQWTEANRGEPARAKLWQLVQQTFQSSGVYTPAQVDDLIRVVERNRNTGGVPATGHSHNWDRVVAEAGAVLSEKQTEDFATAVKYLRTQEEMTAMTRRK